jgi:SAM-dependent methyltransferase
MSGMAGDWGGGYVTDIGYMPGWYSQQSPMHLAVTCLLMGVACDLPAGDEPVHYLELGCGLGFGALALAAANPSWRVTGVDFNPAHVAFARGAARDAGLDNVVFLEADLSVLAEQEEARQIPQADFVSLHGVWSWVPAPVRAGIVRLLRAKVAPGGIVHISYNSLPGWQPALGMQRTLRLAGEAAPGRSDRRALAGVALLRDLIAAEAVHLAGTPFARRMAERLESLPPEYLAHEYMNACWAPCFHADVMADLAAAKLDWIGSATLPENFPELMLTEPQRAIYNRCEDMRLRELVKDMCLHRGLRHDVFVRGVQRLDPAVRDAALGDLVLALATPVDSVEYQVEVASGTASLSPAFYGPMIAAMAQTPRRVADLLALPGIEGRRDNLREVVGILVGIGHGLPLLRPGLPPQPAALRFNRMAANWLVRPENMTKPLALAAASVGGGFPATLLDLFVHARLQSGEDEGTLASWVAALGPRMDEEDRSRLHAVLSRSLTLRLPLMRAAGVW